ncbi:sensor histidine kinase [Trueperella bialowiezensis]|uniref:Sensor histidine kinase desK n=1 Tax=Trueperella bialowiezensis TaxID=312285 RepID=A0A448PEN0_9ACTO|nr:sensor histidine kinase [Trueperella bialowiezensis]VEI13405.1 Sensor histidine kinase desK [Trueperella bialowiezensis]
MSTQQLSERVGRIVSYGMALVWLGFLAFPIWALIRADLTGLELALRLGVLALFAAMYVWGMVHALRREDPFSDELRPLAVVLVVSHIALMLAFVALTEPESWMLGTFTVALAVITLPPRYGYPLGALLATTCSYALISTFGGSGAAAVLIIVGIYATVVGSSYFSRQSDREIAVSAREAVVSERERVARDVHDVLGHTLTVISLKSDLAHKLIDRDPARAKSEISDIHNLSRQAIAEVRATVSGLSVRQLSAELEAVRKLANNAGLALEVRGTPDDVDPRHRILFAWILREAMTNVIRHAGASRARVQLEQSRITVSDDGRGFDPATCEGHGLAGLRKRVEDAGGTMEIDSSPGGGTTIEVRA